MNNQLIVYYSHSGNTKKLAELIGQKTGCALFEIKPVDAYPVAYSAVVEQAKREIKAGYRPALQAFPENMQDYDTIFVGSPNWWSTIAPPVATFLKNCDLSGKTLIPFCTHGGGGFAGLERDIKALCPSASMLSGLALYEDGGRGGEISSWLKRIGIEETND